MIETALFRPRRANRLTCIPYGGMVHSQRRYACPPGTRLTESLTMTTSAVSTHTLEISGMTGDMCVNKVLAALRGVHGVMTKSVKVGSASISAVSPGIAAAIAAIGTAGFKAHEATHAAGAPAAKTQGQPVPYVATPAVHIPAQPHAAAPSAASTQKTHAPATPAPAAHVPSASAPVKHAPATPAPVASTPAATPNVKPGDPAQGHVKPAEPVVVAAAAAKI
jgi:hypothetical protein